MRKLVANALLGFRIAAFALLCFAALPVLLLKAAGDWASDRIECRWPDSRRALAVSFWIRLLTPVVLNIILLIALIWLIARLWTKHDV